MSREYIEDIRLMMINFDSEKIEMRMDRRLAWMLTRSGECVTSYLGKRAVYQWQAGRIRKLQDAEDMTGGQRDILISDRDATS